MNGWSESERHPSGFSDFGASDPDDLAVLLSAALHAAGVEHHVVVVFEGKFVKAIELRKGKREEWRDGEGVYIARVACGPADIGEANGLLLTQEALREGVGGEMAFRVLIQGLTVECDTAEEAMTLAGWKGERRKEAAQPRSEVAPTSSPSSPPTPLWEQALQARKKAPLPLQPNGKKRRGFACMDPKLVSEIARKGGKAGHAMGRAHEFTREEAQEAGRKGGATTAQNRQHMATIGRMGGHLRHGTAPQRQLDLPMGERPSSGSLDRLVRDDGRAGTHEDSSPKRSGEDGDDGQAGGQADKDGRLLRGD